MFHALPRFAPLKACRALALLSVVLIATGCYMPVRFDTEIEIERTGYYKFIFDGYLADVELFDGLNKRTIDRTAEREAVAKIDADMARDPNVTNYEYHKRGHFRLGWEREGDLLQAKSVTFLRRNEFFFGISYNRDTRQIGVMGRGLARKQKNQLVDLGLNMQGQLRVITDAKVVGHNADTVKPFKARGPRWQVYIFDFQNIYRPTPVLNISLI